jgi:uncharacterized protein (DUF3820 family)
MSEQNAPPGEVVPSGEVLIELCRARMPFGKYRGVRLVRLPEAYLAWFKRQGMPKGKLGQQLESALVVRSSGLEPLLAPILEALDREEASRDGRSD